MSFFPEWMKNAVVLKIWGTVNNKSCIDLHFIFYVHDSNDVCGRNYAIIIFPSLSLFRNLTQITWLFFIVYLFESHNVKIKASICIIMLQFRIYCNTPVWNVPFSLFIISMSDGFFFSPKCRKKWWYTDTCIEKKSFSQLSLVLRNIFIYFKFSYKIFAQFFIVCFFSPFTANLPFILHAILELLCAYRRLSSFSCKQRGQKRLYQLNTHRQEMRLIDMIVNFFCWVLSMLDAPRVFD